MSLSTQMAFWFHSKNKVSWQAFCVSLAVIKFKIKTMSISETLALYEKAQKDSFIADSLIDSCRKSIKNKVKEIINKKYKHETIKIKSSILRYYSCIVHAYLYAHEDYRDSKVTIDILFLADKTKENKKIIDKAYDDFINENKIKADETLAIECRCQLPLIDVLQNNFSFKFQ